MTSQPSLREKLIGTWELITYRTELLSDPSNKVYPLGTETRGTIVYTHDGYMSANVLRLGQAPFEWGNGVMEEVPGTLEEWAQAGKNYIAYSGRFFFDETGGPNGEPLLLHELSVCNIPKMVGIIQKRMFSMDDGDDGVRYLNLGIEKVEIAGEERAVKVRWRKMADNAGAKIPEKYQIGYGS